MTGPSPADDLQVMAHDRLVHQFETCIAPALRRRIDESRDQGTSFDLLRDMYEAGKELAPRSPAVRRTLEKVAAGVVECQLLSRMHMLHGLWPDPQIALAMPKACRAITGIHDDDIDCAGPALGNAIASSVREAAPLLGETFDADDWIVVLLEVLKPWCPLPPNDNVVNLDAERLLRLYASQGT